MYVTRARIENVRIVSDFDLELSENETAGWHVILGDNGAGKSTFIRAMALALIGRENAAALRQDWRKWLGTGADAGGVSLSIQDDADHDQWVVKGKKSKKPIKPEIKFRRKGDGDFVSADFSGQFAERTVWGDGSGWFSAAFGPFRRFLGGDREYEKLYYSHPRLAAHLSAFGEDVALSEALDWVKNIQFRALEKDDMAAALIDGLLGFINSSNLLPHKARIAEIASSGIMIDDGAGARVPVEEMSDGYRSVLAMTFELLRAMEASFGPERLLEAIDTDGCKVNLPGVILIDEIDAHLHPAWQKDIGGWFVERFPRAQFFVTTHSPIICQTAEKGSIWRFASPGSGETSGRVTGRELGRLVYGGILEAYSTMFFGDDVTRSDSAKEMLRRLAELNRKSLKGTLDRAEEDERSVLRSRFPSKASDLEA